MSQQGRNESGQFAPKSDEARQVRSVRLTDSVWDKLGEIATSKNITRGDFLEELVKLDIINIYNNVINLQAEINNLKSEVDQYNIKLSKESYLKVDKIAALRCITREELIEWVLNSNIFEEKTKLINKSQVTVTRLAEILNVDAKTIRDYRDGKRKQTLVDWSKAKTLDGKGWDYDPATKLYFQVD